MDIDQPKNSQAISWWIASLAGSVLLCTVFAGYVFNIKEDLENSKVRASLLEQHVNILSSEVDTLRRHVLVQQIQVVPSEKSIQLTAPAPEAPSVNVAPAMPPMPVPTSSAPMPTVTAPTTPPVMPPSMPMPSSTPSKP